MADCKRKAPLLHDNPLCGISTYKDTLNLATGVCTRIISKYEFTGQENWVRSNAGYFYTGNAFSDYNNTRTLLQKLSSMFSHYIATMNDTNGNSLSNGYACLYCSIGSPNNYHEVYIRDNGYSTANDFKAYLAQQYANGTPVTIWYVLAEPTTETITVPSGLSGTEEGYLIQDGTPMPTQPIYPTANNVEVWLHSLRKLTTATEAVENPLYSDSTAITSYTIKGNTVQNGTPTPSAPISVSGVGNLETSGEHRGEYKIPILSGGVTTNIYLGSTQSVRQVKKVVLTGEETECAYAQGTFYLSDITDYAKLNNAVTCLCSHFIANNNITSISVAQAGVCFYAGSDTSTYRLYLKDSTIQSKSDWQTYLAAQYANGTPVTVWYVLATPETTTVNEPLMKIGDYADTISNATAIPTTEGANSITVDTTVQPSEFTATWTGWHDSSVKEYVGGHTVNLFDDTNVINVNGLGNRYGVILPDGTYSIYNGTDNTMYYGVNNWIGRFSACEPHSTATITLTNNPGTVGGVFMPLDSSSQGGCTVVEGSTPPDHYIPYYTWVDD